MRDYKDYQEDKFDFDSVSSFIVKSTFVGPGPDIIRELSTENAMKIFTYNKPVMIMFRNTSAPDVRYYHKELSDAYEDISNRIMVAIADINNSITQKIAMLVGLDVDRDHFPAIRILDPNPGKSNVLKYYYNQDNIDKDKIIQFVKDFESGLIKPYRKVENEPKSRSNYITALNS